MRLELHKVSVRNVSWGDETKVEKGTLFVNREEMLSVAMKDNRFARAELEFARPGESVRIIPVKDVIEPRCKLSGPGEVFPGFVGGMQTVGEGATLVLDGAAVVTCGPIVAFQEGLIDMSGPAADYSPFSQTNNVVLVVEPVEGLDQHSYEAALREAGFRLGWYLADKGRGSKADEVKVYEMGGPVEESARYPHLPKIAYLCMSITQGLLHDTFLYGADMKHLVPTLIHPNEKMDGAMVSGNCVSACDKNTTWHHLNDPIVEELYSRHGKDLVFLGVIPTLEDTRLAGKERTSWFNANLARMLGADGVVVSEEGYGNPDTDLCMNAAKCEKLGIRTVVISDEAAGTDGKSQGLADAAPEITAFVSAGNVNEMIELPAMDRILGYDSSISNLSGGAGESLRKDGSMFVELQAIIGSTNELGFSRIGARWI
ncbi:MAG TPA: beta-aspartyl-peptidase [Synergistaceae bacterium]|nr:MAG: Glycine/sarcosine/betaine reductase complex protein B alpha and beta subunit [Synergistales bacterium 57_84]KUK88757.1 MAG: Glycine/sarcosine/betaine reductase complex protein B alpha and beta subunit [Synergistales bacterium 58_81]HBG15011.1 beta-aspartyl-peptidase [Synergistaceae bacterium]